MCNTRDAILDLNLSLAESRTAELRRRVQRERLAAGAAPARRRLSLRVSVGRRLVAIGALLADEPGSVTAATRSGVGG
jgi:hypothetical protein